MSATSWPRHLSNMLQDLSNKIFFATLRALIFVNQMVSLAPIRSRKVQEITNFYVHRWRTIWALLSWILLVALSPIFIWGHASLYDVVNVKSTDELYLTVSLTTTIFEVASSLLILPTVLWKRKQLSNWLNIFIGNLKAFHDFNRELFSWRILLLFFLRITCTLYLIGINLPFIFSYLFDIQFIGVVGFFGILYLQVLSCIFALDMFVAFLCFYANLRQVERNLKRARSSITIQRLLLLEQSISECAGAFTNTFQFPILLVLLYKFVNLLANIYAILDYYASINVLYFHLLFYGLFIFIDLYSLIMAAYCCCALHERVKDRLLQRRIFRYSNFADPLWPRALEFRILDMFSINHEFWLFLVSYSANFVVLILQFAMRKSIERNL